MFVRRVRKISEAEARRFGRWVSSSKRGRTMNEFCASPFAVHTVRAILAAALTAGYEIDPVLRKTERAERYRFVVRKGPEEEVSI